MAPSDGSRPGAHSFATCGSLYEPSHPPPHPEAPRSGLAGGLQRSPRHLEASCEAYALLRHLRMRSRVGWR
ncbi:hypothetical protein DK412_09990 [Methylobacterium sp. 17Sr1-1]|nr:hypothetical protein DK412_09990 [Methylobacterium sp. 17Sr1-1]